MKGFYILNQIRKNEYLVSEFLLCTYVVAFSLLSFNVRFTIIENLVALMLIMMLFLSIAISRDKKVFIGNEHLLLYTFILLNAALLLLSISSFRRYLTFFLVITLFFAAHQVLYKTKRTISIEYGLFLSIVIIFLMNPGIIINAYSIGSERISFTFANPNTYAYLLLLASLLFIKRLVFTKDLQSNYLKIVFTVFILFCWYQIVYLTGSRKDTISIIIILIFIFLFIYKNSNYLSRIILIAFMALVGYYLYSLLAESYIFSRLMELFISIGSDNYGGSVRLRGVMIEKALELWSEKPFLGWGFDSFRYVSGFGKYSHNNYMELLVNSGLIGFVVFYSIYLVVLYKMFKHIKNKGCMNGNDYWILLIICVCLFRDMAFVSYYNKLFYLNLAIIVFEINNLKINTYKLKKIE